MAAGIQTFVLILHMLSGVVAVPGYGSAAECDKALEVAKVASKQVVSGFCVPGPVERR